MTNYRLLIDFEVIGFIETRPRKDQLALRNRFAAIRDFPANFSDFVENDTEGRRVDIHIFGKYAIKYWQDHADRDIKVLHVHLADRAL